MKNQCIVDYLPWDFTVVQRSFVEVWWVPGRDGVYPGAIRPYGSSIGYSKAEDLGLDQHSSRTGALWQLYQSQDGIDNSIELEGIVDMLFQA